MRGDEKLFDDSVAIIHAGDEEQALAKQARASASKVPPCT